MQNSKTYYQIILDESSSMTDCYEVTVNGLNEQIKKILELAEKFPEQEIVFGLTIFSDQVRFDFNQISANELKKVEHIHYRPYGNTALYDAIGLSIQQLENKSINSDDSFVVIILTDGYENASKIYSQSNIKQKIKELEATEKWTFCYLGATLDSVEIAENLNIKARNAKFFRKEQMKSEVWENLSLSMDRYLDKKLKGDKLNNFLISDDEDPANQ